MVAVDDAARSRPGHAHRLVITPPAARTVAAFSIKTAEKWSTTAVSTNTSWQAYYNGEPD